MSDKTYTLTQRDYDILVKETLNNPTALGVLQRIAGQTNDKLDDKKMSELFGTNYHGIIYYNFETNTWNRKNPNAGIDTTHALELKKRVETDPKMRDIEIIAAVAMPISETEYPGWGAVVHNPKYSSTGNSIVGTVVRRDKRTGKILPIASGWIGIRQMRRNGFVFNGFRYWDFARTFRQIHGLEK